MSPLLAVDWTAWMRRLHHWNDIAIGCAFNVCHPSMPLLHCTHCLIEHALQAESRGQRMREVEPATVTALDYIISNDGTSNTCAKLKLRLSDPASPLQGRTFEVELPPPNCGHAEFVVPRHRFLTSVHRMWKRGDCCQVQCCCAYAKYVAFNERLLPFHVSHDYCDDTKGHIPRAAIVCM